MSKLTVEQRIKKFRSNNKDGSTKLLIHALDIIHEWSTLPFQNSIDLQKNLNTLINKLILCHPIHVHNQKFIIYVQQRYK